MCAPHAEHKLPDSYAQAHRTLACWISLLRHPGRRLVERAASVEITAKFLLLLPWCFHGS